MLFRQPIVALSLLAFLCGGIAARAADSDPVEEYDFSWLDPDKKIYVVQNRKYQKANRLELRLAGALGFGEPYRTRRSILPRATFYVNEQFGVSAIVGFNKNAENDNVAALKQVSSRIPAVRDVGNFVGGSVLWLPFYGKVNMFNQIFYLDWHVEAGVGQVNSEIDNNTRTSGLPNIEEGSFFSFHWGTGQKFFVTRNWAVHLDFLAQYYKAPSGVSSDPSATNLTTAAGTPDDTYTNYYGSLGISYTF